MYVSDRKLEVRYAVDICFQYVQFCCMSEIGNGVVKWCGFELLLLFQRKIEMHIFEASNCNFSDGFETQGNIFL